MYPDPHSLTPPTCAIGTFLGQITQLSGVRNLEVSRWYPTNPPTCDILTIPQYISPTENLWYSHNPCQFIVSDTFPNNTIFCGHLPRRVCDLCMFLDQSCTPLCTSFKNIILLWKTTQPLPQGHFSKMRIAGNRHIGFTVDVSLLVALG
jgi:hypothetical protein